ncbi:hypothetical protein DFQ28_004741, partial [Apophysomyces sp. BC1034]
MPQAFQHKKRKKVKKREQNKMSIPTNDRLACEDSTESMDLAKLLAENTDKPIVFGGTDYGIVTTSCTSVLTMDRLYKHVDLYNYYNTLRDTSSDDEDTDMAGTESHAVDTKLPNTYEITAKQIDEITLTRKNAKKRECRKR